MAFETGTYGSTIYAMTPSKILPSPDDMITWDWMDAVGLFSQRFFKMATTIATIANGGTATFDYSALRCDYFPPFLKAYVFNPVSSGYDEWIGTISTGTGMESWMKTYHQFVAINLGTARLINNTGTQRIFQLLAYL